MDRVGIGLVGCGYVADYYMATLPHYPAVDLRAVYDRDAARLAQFCNYHKATPANSLEQMLEDPSIQIVLNLTNPRSHYAVSRQCLDAGRHVYSEKPLAMRYEDAAELVKMASEKGLRLSAAPCSSLGRAARTLAHAVASGICGEVRLVYAELDDGPVHKMAFKNWRSDSGAPWPYRDEFEVGCTLEHAGYVVSWLVKMFGAVESVTAFSDCLIEHKLDEEEPLEPAETADASFGLLKFESGVVARLTTTIVATHDHSIRLFGERGVVSLKECWNNSCPVYFRRLMRLRRKTFLSPLSTRVRLPDAAPIIKMSRGNTHMDFMLGVQDLAQSIIYGAEPEMSADFALHITEVALALQNAGTDSGTYMMRSRP